jgi:hypothetical protein
MLNDLATIDKDPIDNCLEQSLIREFVYLHDQLKGIATKLAQCADDTSDTVTVYRVDGKNYQLLKRTCPLPYELPVIVKSARVVS